MRRVRSIFIIAGALVAIGTVSASAQGPDTYWTRTYGGTSSDYGYSIQQTQPDGGYIVVGTTFSFGEGSYDIYLI